MVVAAMLAAYGGQMSAQDTDYVPQRSDYSFHSDVHAINDDGDVRWDSIVVYLTDAKGHTQELYSQALPLDTLQWNRNCIGEIVEDDWNFDGIPDLQVCTGPMNGFGNYTYDVWLWNDKTHKFEELIWRLDDEVEIIKYKWKDGKLFEFEREQMSASNLADD